MTAQQNPSAVATTLGAAIDGLLHEAVSLGTVPGVVAAVADRSGVLHEGAAGVRRAGTDAPMGADTMVWIASMSKAITSAAAMQLVEQGKLALDTPISAVLPALAEPKVLTGFAADGTPQLRPASRPITLRHLLTHTSGHTYPFWNADCGRYEQHVGSPGIVSCQNAALEMPLMFDPGERWEYGIGIDWAGKAVEAVSGQRLDHYLREHIFEPLGMADTGFALSIDQIDRQSSVHARTPDGLVPIEFGLPPEPEFHMGGGGLYATVGDYLRFLRMILGEGELDGQRVLEPSTVAMMVQNQIGELDMEQPMISAMPDLTHDVDLFPGMTKKWGLSFMVTTEDTPRGRRAGSVAWAGLANSYYWIDPTAGVTGVLATQILPFADPAVLDLFDRFEAAVYSRINAS
jgi:CubicO group peptidase (beta-lactamase class C family)